AEILRAAARDVPLDPAIDLAALADELDGFSAADCAALIREAALAAMRESLDATTVDPHHLAAARERVRPSLDPVQVVHLEAYAASRRARYGRERSGPARRGANGYRHGREPPAQPRRARSAWLSRRVPRGAAVPRRRTARADRRSAGTPGAGTRSSYP